jgi:hypothetical protein
MNPEQDHMDRFEESESSTLLNNYINKRCYTHLVDINGYTFNRWAKDNNKTNDDAPFDEWVCMCEQYLNDTFIVRRQQNQSKQYPI